MPARRAVRRSSGSWEVCQVPDYRKVSPSSHAELVATLYGFLSREGKIPDDWYSSQITQADRTDGGIDTLSARIAHIRTWTFVANRPDWLEDPEHWQGIARGVEDRLSDALHERLAERFVDRRTSVLMRRLKENTMLETEISKTGDVVVEGHTIGRLEGFRFTPDASAGGSEAKMLTRCGAEGAGGEIEQRATRLSQSAGLAIRAGIGRHHSLGRRSGGKAVARRQRVAARACVSSSDEHLTGPSQELVQTRIDLWTRTSRREDSRAAVCAERCRRCHTALRAASPIRLLNPSACWNARRWRRTSSRSISPRAPRLRNHGVRFGAYHLYIPTLLKPAPRSLAAQALGR